MASYDPMLTQFGAFSRTLQALVLREARFIISRSNASVPHCGRASATFPANSARSEVSLTDRLSISLQPVATGRGRPYR